jgi:pseudouridine synthase
LLLTNDGGLARTLELPETGWLRRYRVRAYGDIDQARLDELKDGIAVDGVLYGAIEATLDRKQGHNVWITMGLREGKNREIKNVLGALGLDVNRLIRISFGPFQLGDIREGDVVEIKSRLCASSLATPDRGIGCEFRCAAEREHRETEAGSQTQGQGCRQAGSARMDFELGKDRACPRPPRYQARPPRSRRQGLWQGS